MSNITTTTNNTDIAPELMKVLSETVYPGAKPASISMAVGYCRAAKLDVMLKPVQIMPMPFEDKTGYTSYRDVIIPGIGFYRILASRSGLYLGISEPEFGPLITETLGTVQITYPEWCKMTVKKIVKGKIAEFTSFEFWKENYATRGKKAPLEPNYMWKKRPYGQLIKCAEAQALRKAFPEIVPVMPTAEEMEGKSFIEMDNEYIAPPKTYQSKTDSMNAMLDSILENDATMASIEPPSAPEEEIKYDLETLCKLINTYSVSDDKIGNMCAKAGKSTIDEFSQEEIERAINGIKIKYESK